MNAWKIKTDNYAAADYGHPANNPAAAFRFAGIAQTGQKAPAFRRLTGN
mgnify:FL=1